MIRLRVFACAAMLCAATLAFGASFTSNGTGGGTWNNTATWGGAGVPGSGDNVTITGSDTVTVVDARTCNSIVLDTTSGNKTLDVNGTGALTVQSTGNAVLVNAPTIGTNLVRLNGGALTLISGDIQIAGGGSSAGRLDFNTGGGTFTANHMLFTGTAANAQVTFSGGAGSVFLSGDLGNGGTISSAGSTFTFNGSTGQTINGYTFDNLTIAKTGTATLNGPVFVNGNLTVSSGLFDDGGNQITLNPGGTSNVNIGSTGVLKLGAAASATSFPLNVNPGNISFQPGSVVVYHAGVPQTINTAISYRRLWITTIAGSVTHSFTGTLGVAEDLTVNDNGAASTTLSVGTATLDVTTDINGDGDVSVSSGFLSLGGNWSNSVGLTAGATSTITYDGSGPQNVRAATYGNLSITKLGGTATLAGATITNAALGISGTGTLATNNNNLTVTGAFGNSATFDAGTSNVTFLDSLTNTGTVLSSNATFILGGTSPQVWSSNPGAITVSGLQISNASGVTIGNNTSVTGTLTLGGGKVTVAGTFFIDVLATVNWTSGWFVGPLTMGFNPTPARRMHVGTTAAYLPIDIDGGSAGTVTARAVEGQQPNKTGPRILNRYWTIDSGSVVPIDSMTFQYSLSDLGSGLESQFMLARYSGGWIRHGDLVAEGPHTATITSISTYTGDWAVGHAGSMGGAGFLKITQVNGGTSPTVNVPFDVDVQARTDDDSANGNAFTNSTVDVTLAAGSGSLLTSSGTLNAGTSFVNVTGLSYDTVEPTVQVTAGTSSGDAIDSGTSAPFAVMAAPSTLTVSSINDSGPGTLRDAIDTANAMGCATPCTINFTTAGTIVLATPLSPITRDDLLIDGYSAPSATPNSNGFGLPDNANITIQLDGSSTIATGFEVQGQNDVIKGFVIKNFTATGVRFTGTNTGSGLEGCFVGTDASGNNAAPNGDGVGFTASFSGSVGGTSAAARNVISGNGMYGVYAGAGSTNIGIYGNYIGVRADLTGALANDDGIQVTSGSSANIGQLSGENLISGNTNNGIEIDGQASVLKNLIGTNGIGTAALPNGTGIFIGPGATGTMIGPTELNVISGNSGNGIEIQGDNNSVSNAYVGLGLDGVTSIPNGGIGVRISGSAQDNSIGVLAANRIAYNTGQGVSVATSSLLVGNVIRTNRIFNNGTITPLAIDLGEDDITPNDATDADGGANGLQNFPTLSNAQISGSNVQLSVSVDSSGTPSGTAAIVFDVYKSDGSAPDQALEYLGSSGCQAGTVFSNYTFTVPKGSVVNGSKIVATATSYQAGCATTTDGTSELSAAATVSGAIHWINGSGGNWSTAGNWNPAQVPTAGDEVYIDAGGSYTVIVSTAEAAGILHVGTGVSGTQTLAVTNTGSLALGSASDVTTTGAMSVVGTLSGTGSLAVNGVFNWDGGTISGSTGLTINSGGLLTINNAVAHALTQRTLTIASGATANWNAGSISMANSAHIDNFGLFEIKTDNSISDGGSDAGFDNLGTLRKSTTSGTTTLTSIDLDHSAGTIDIQTGTIDLGAGSATAPIAISSGATLLVNSDTFTLGNGAGITGLGKIHITSGTVDVTGAAVSVEHLYLQGGTLGGTGTISGVTGNTWQWDGGTMSGTGTTIVPAGATLLAGSASSKALNQRTLQVSGSGTFDLGGTGALSLSNGGNINNAGIFDLIGDATIQDGGFAGSIVNSGTFKKSGTPGGTTVLSNVTLTNSGTIHIQTGTLDPADVSNSGTITNAGTLLVNSNTVTLNAGSSVGGAGLVQVTSGTLTVDGPAVTFPNLQLDGGTINGTAVFNATALLWNGGTMSGTGTTNIPAAASATIATAAAKALNQRSFNIAPSGTVTLSGSGTINMLNGGNFTNNGLFDITGDGGFNDAGSAGTIANTGTFRKSTSTNTTSLTNINFNHSGGTLDVQTGTFDLAGGTSSAPIALSAGTTFLVNSQTYTFAAGTTVSGAGLVSVAGGTLSATGNVAIPQFSLSSGTLDGAATVTLTNSADWSGGTMQGGGMTTVDPAATLTITGASGKSLNNRTLSTVIGGTVTASGSGTINLLNGGSISNAGLFDFTGDAALNDAGFGGAFANTGTLRKSTSTNTTVFSNVSLNHSAGTLDLQSGTFDLAGGTSSAPIAVASSATLLFNSNTYTLAAGTTFSGTGMVSLQAGTLNVTGNISIPQFGMTNGTLDGAGTLALTNVADWSGGTMQGGGATAVVGGATLTISSPSAKALNNRTLSTVATATINITGVGTINFLNGGNVNNAGTFVTDVDSTLADAGFGGGFTNTGTFRKQTTTGPTTFTNVALTNNGGLIDLQTGTLSLSSFIQSAASTLRVRLGGTGATQFSKLTTTSTPTLAGTLDVTLAGLYQPAGGDVFQILTSPGGAHSGDFTQPYSYPALTGGRTFSDAYNGSGLLLTVTGSADLAIVKSAAANNYPVSSPISYTIAVTNNGPDAASGVSVSDTLPAGHTLITANGTGWNCNVAGSTVTCTAVSSLPTGAAPNITINATTPSTPQSFTNTATVSSSNDGNGTNDSSGWPITIDPNTVDIDVSSTSPGSPVAQSTGFSFDFTIKNNGPQTATGVVFNAPIPSTLSFSSATPDQGPPCTFVSGVVTCNLGTIASGGSPHVLLNLTTGTTPGTHYVTGSATQLEADSNLSNNSIATPVQVIGASVIVTNTNDIGAGSLRQALLDAQNTSGCPAPCAIQFNIGSGPFVIQPQSDLPAVAASAIVDGTTQPGYAGTPVIQVDGTLTPTTYLMTLSAGGSTVRGLSLTNATKGVYINSNNNVVLDNHIGVTPAGGPAGNGNGVVVDGSDNRIATNTIAFNLNNGVDVVTGIGNRILGNSVHDNTLLGIDLANDGATPNDANDADTGANNLQNFPTLTAAFIDAGNDLHVSYTHNSSGAANVGSVFVEIFKADSVAAGQGKTLLASNCFAFDTFGGGTSFNAPAIVAGDPIVLTATGYSDSFCLTASDGTSEFSNVVPVANCVPPAAAINAPANACANSTGNAASVNAPAATEFTWTVTGGTLLSGQGTASITFSAPASGSVGLSVLVRDGNGCPNTTSTSVPVVAVPNATITAPPSACASSTGNSGSVAPGAASYLWTITNGTITAGQGTNAITFSAGASGSVSLGVTAANGSCSTSGSASVPIGAAPAVSITAPPSVCPSSTGNNASVPAGASSYFWTIANGTITAGQGTSAIVFSAGASGSVSLGVSVTNGSCTSNGSASVPVAPLAVNISGPTIACPNQPFVLDAGAGYATYAWNTGDTSRFITVTQSAASATYSVTVTNGSCSGNDSHTVNLGGTPDPNITTALSVDANSTNNAASVPSQPGASYSWFISNGFITSGDGTNSILFTAGASGVVNLNVTVNVGGCNASSAAGVLINGVQPTCPSVPPSLLLPANNAIVTSPATFSWTAIGGATSYELWINNALAATTASTSISNAIPNGTSSWFVIARLDGNCANLVSATRTFSTPSQECGTAVPSLVTPQNGAQLTNGHVTFQWNGIAGATSYDVYLAPLNGTPVPIGNTNATSLTHDVPPGELTWSVVANVAGCPPRSSQSANFSYTPPVACEDNRRPLLISPLDGSVATSPVSFDWTDVPGATKYEVYTIRGNDAPVLIGTSTTSSLPNVNLGSGKLRQFSRAYFGPGCSPLDSEERELEIVNPPEPCSPLATPFLAAPGEISSGVEFLLQWGAVPGATAYQLQLDNGDPLTVSGTSFPLTRTSSVTVRVRAMDTRCSPPAVSDYSPAAVIFILPQQQRAIGNVPFTNPAAVHYTIPLGAEFAGQSFIATPSEEWLSVVPATGTVGASGTTLNVIANPRDLTIGSHSGAIVVSLNDASSRLATNGSTVSSTVSVNLVTPVTPAPSSAPTPDTMIIPAVANADGINSHFQSDVRVANTSAKLIKYQLTFIPSGDAGSSAGRQTTFSIDPGQSVALDDVLKSWFGTGTSNAIGVLQIKPLTTTSSSIAVPNFGPLSNLVSFASSRTFNVTPNGTFGQYIPAVPFANFADKSTVLSIQQIAQSIKARSNLGLVEGSGNPADLLIRVFGGNGQQLTSFTQHLNGGQHTQLNSFLLERGITLEDGRVEIQVTSSTGKVTAYASVLDNETSDAVLVTPVPLTAQGNTKWVLPGVADIRSGFADWQSDVRIFNAGVTSTNVTASFYSQAGGEPRVQTIALGAGEVRQLDKILPALFGVSNDAGALHLSTATASRIIATARTYNQTTKGTYGQFISAVTPQESVAVGTRPLQLLQVEESSRMRSNIGFAEVTGKAVKLEVTVIPPDAKFAGVIEVDLGPNEYRQIGSLLASLGLGDTYNARISVRAVSGQGRATTYASVIDLATNDPMYVLPQ